MAVRFLFLCFNIIKHLLCWGSGVAALTEVFPSAVLHLQQTLLICWRLYLFHLTCGFQFCRLVSVPKLDPDGTRRLSLPSKTPSFTFKGAKDSLKNKWTSSTMAETSVYRRLRLQTALRWSGRLRSVPRLANRLNLASRWWVYTFSTLTKLTELTPITCSGTRESTVLLVTQSSVQIQSLASWLRRSRAPDGRLALVWVTW